jgi:hypothetical protein
METIKITKKLPKKSKIIRRKKTNNPKKTDGTIKKLVNSLKNVNLGPYSSRPLMKQRMMPLNSEAVKKSMTKKYIAALADPWNAVDVRLPSVGGSFTCTAKVKSYYSFLSNASGKVLFYVDPNFISKPADTGTAQTAAFYVNASALDGVTALVGSYYTPGPLNSVPTPPSTTQVTKCRLISAGMKVVAKISALNYVATAITCLDYGDYTLMTAGSGITTQSTSATKYTVFSNILNGVQGQKFDLGISSDAVFFRWLPVDPLSDIFVDAGGWITDSNGQDAGGSARFVIALQDLPASSTIDVEMVWNVEYLPAAIAKPWLSGAQPGSGIPSSEMNAVRDSLSIIKGIHGTNDKNSSQIIADNIAHKLYDDGFTNNYVRGSR